jgi:DNA-binding MarR family transcriptional regulator
MTNIDRQPVHVNASTEVRSDDQRRNVVVQLREAYKILNALVPVRLVDQGFTDFRPAHSSVFEHLDDTGTTVSTLADRATMTKQAMAELVEHLEECGYVVRIPDPNDRRAKLVLPTDRGRKVYQVARAFVPELHTQISNLIGQKRFEQLRHDLDLLCREFAREQDT